jgi:hypothetical protein
MENPAGATTTEQYERERAEAEADGTAIPERVHDFPPADLFHAAQALHEALTGADGGDGGLLEEVDAPEDPALWERLDVARVAALMRERRPDAFAPLAARFPWLADAADGSGTGALGAMSDQF